MNASRNTKIGATVALVVALAAAGGAFAASKHGGSKAAAGLSVGSYVSSSSGGTTAPRFGRGHGPGDELAVAATYLGLSQSELQTQLQAGKTLGAIADATSGKSKAGLIDKLVAAEKDEWAQAVKDGKLTQAQVDAMLPNLTQRMTDLANGVRPAHGPGGPGLGGHGHGHRDGLAAAATYLGLSPSELQTQLQAGKTLGAIADATSGKSKAGLIDALVSAETTELAQAVKDGNLTQAQADQIAAGLTDRVTSLVNGVMPPRGPGGHDGPGFGGPPPMGGSSDQPAPSTHI